MSVSRRTLLWGATATAATAAAVGALPSPALGQGTRPLAAPTAVAQRKVGRVTVTALSDGFIEAPLGVFTGAPAPEIDRAFAARFARRGDGTARLGFTVWLVDDGQRRVLIDGGAGKALPTSGRLPAVLASLGVQPDSVNAVLTTHLHFDHIAGLIDNGRAAFPNAEVYAPRADVAYFTDAARASAAPDLLKGSFQAASAFVAATPRLQRFDGERALTPFISSVDLAGHTPGHTGFRIADGGETLLIVGDALFDPALHPQNPEIGIAFEADPAAATRMRQQLYARAAEERALLAATHMPFPGFGRIVADGTSRRWVPADWEYAN